jgi:hypothetical protein
MSITEEMLLSAKVSVDVSTGDDLTAGDRIFGAVVDWQIESDGSITLLCEYTSDNLGVPFCRTPSLIRADRAPEVTNQHPHPDSE